MSEKIIFDYFYNHEADMVCFYRIPKFLVTNERFSKMKTEAKMLYGLLLDRMSLWQNMQKKRSWDKDVCAETYTKNNTVSGFYWSLFYKNMGRVFIKNRMCDFRGLLSCYAGNHSHVCI